ncbi:hypothetical protein HNR46_001256 [Haloferula luteola]|uniref:Uncharacterized protein n=1 Tax=Haloferula luteola TaxID=595692 RepID=A0A840UZ19_9BACT|nr:hypothetical protein [Haloferula luteola]MBB5351022.1 hypothetical protein [Haloferula luteola]
MSDPFSHPDGVTQDTLRRCWEACWARARRPVEGILLPNDQATHIAERALRNASLSFKTFPGEGPFLATALEETARAAREGVALQRRDHRDPQLHHDPGDSRYERNLNLDRLQRRDAERGFHDREWNDLPPVLRPLALHTLSRKGIRGPDADEVFNDSLLELARERNDGGAPILDLTVFEELIPLHTRITGFRAIDWMRKKSAQKNRPNAGESFDALTDDPDHRKQFEDPNSDPDQATFERIYSECREDLTDLEWDLIYSLYVAQSAPVQDLLADDAFCRRHGIRTTASPSTKRRELLAKAEEALGKIRKSFQV